MIDISVNSLSETPAAPCLSSSVQLEPAILSQGIHSSSTDTKRKKNSEINKNAHLHLFYTPAIRLSVSAEVGFSPLSGFR